MSKHTPGKWFSTDAMKDIFDGCTVIVSEEVDDAIICSMGGDMFEAEANARLIAAAPTMLEALKQAKNWIAGPEPHDNHCAFICNGGGECDCPVPAIDAAIELAEGE